MNERRRDVSRNTGWGFWGEEGLHFPLSRSETKQLVKAALEEDNTMHDVTTIATVVSDRRARSRLVARQSGVIAGIPLAAEAFRQIDPSVTIRIDHDDGSAVEGNTLVMYLSGHARGLLSAERVALNFMQRMSGVATLTAKYVEAVKGTGARILDTRKTTPLWRKLEKYAVRAGGGLNHRMDLAAAVLMKDNHIAAIDGDIAAGIRRAREISRPGIQVEVECDTLEQVSRAMNAGADIIMLDNMPAALIREAVLMVSGRAILEASGGINLETVRGVAETGVDWISVGALTHSAPALDLALDFE